MERAQESHHRKEETEEETAEYKAGTTQPSKQLLTPWRTFEELYFKKENWRSAFSCRLQESLPHIALYHAAAADISWQAATSKGF